MTASSDLVARLRESAHPSMPDLSEAAARILALEADKAALVEVLESVYAFADKTANGLTWHFRDQSCAKAARATLAKHRCDK